MTQTFASNPVVDLALVEESIRAISASGRLVPFIGAGISAPLCRGWRDLLDTLNRDLSIRLAKPDDNANADVLYRLADRAAFALRLLPHAERRARLAKALINDERKAEGLPQQAVSLASGFWPLIVTTNYDDVYLRAKNDFTPRNHIPLRIRGRGKEDCEAIVRSFDVDHPPTLWCVQGFIGNVAADTPLRAIKRSDLNSLTDEVVLGHQQYQVAANSNPHFRRSFAELYRRRSIIFIGSGLTESYFVNLISEIVLNYGPGPHQHFALFSDRDLVGDPGKGRLPVDVEFLAVRLGIIPVRYGSSHAALPEALRRIATEENGDTVAPAPSLPPVAMRSFSFNCPRRSNVPDTATEVSIRFAPLPEPASKSCIVLSAGIYSGSGGIAPIFGPQGRQFFKAEFGWGPEDMALGKAARWEPAATEPRLFRLMTEAHYQPIFALAARDLSVERLDQRNLLIIEDATCRALTYLEGLREFHTIQMGLLGGGDRAFVYPTFPFLAQIRGIRQFLQNNTASDGQALSLIEINIVDPRIIAPSIAERLPIQESLTSDLVRVLVRVADESGTLESYAIAVGAHETVAQVLSRYPLPLERMHVLARPLPYPEFAPILEAPVFPMMIIQVEPTSTITAAEASY